MPQPYIIGDSSPFLKRVLIPFWVLRIIVMVGTIGVYAVAIAAVSQVTKSDFDNQFSSGEVKKAKSTIMAIAAVIMVLVLICLSLDVVSIIKRSRRKLSPRFFLISNVLQTTLWLILFIMSMVGGTSGLAVALMVIVLLSFVGLLIYAIVIFHQFRKGKLNGVSYAPAANDPSGNTEYSGPYNHEMPAAVPQPAYYGEAQQPAYYGEPQQPGYNKQPGYGYEPNRAV